MIKLIIETERTLWVKIGNEISNSFNASSEVAQGSHPCPLIFLLYFNDVHHVPQLAFADDLKICSKINSDLLFLQLDIFAHWCELNHLVFNPAKCSVITFSRKLKPQNFNYNLISTLIPHVEYIKNLVIVDSRCNYKQHLLWIVTWASRMLDARFHCSTALYCSLARSTLENELLFNSLEPSLQQRCSPHWKYPAQIRSLCTLPSVLETTYAEHSLRAKMSASQAWHPLITSWYFSCYSGRRYSNSSSLPPRSPATDQHKCTTSYPPSL